MSKGGRTCIHCHEQTHSHILCHLCHGVQPFLKGAAAPSPFAYFGVPASFDLDLQALEQRYFYLQRQVHPDCASTGNGMSGSNDNKSNEISTHLMHHGMQVNMIYTLLKNPLSRGIALLEAHTGPVNLETAPQDPQMLWDVMQRQESLAAAKGFTELNELVMAAEVHLQHTLAVVKALFAASAPRDALLSALMVLKYAQKWRENSRDKLRQIPK